MLIFVPNSLGILFIIESALGYCINFHDNYTLF